MQAVRGVQRSCGRRSTPILAVMLAALMMVLAPMAQAAPGGGLARGAGSAGLFFPSVPPNVTKVNPKTGPAAGGTTVLITGTHMRTTNGVKFGSVNAASFEVISSELITAVSPAELSGRVDVTVTTAVGTSPTSSRDRFTFMPTVTSLTPSAGPVAGGTEVTVGGSGFAPGSTFRFGSKPARMASCTSSTTCTVVAPAHGAGTVDVLVTANRVRSQHTPPGDRFAYVSPPTLTGLSPNEGPEAGGTSVTITGANFTGESTVKFGASSASNVKVNSASSITAEAPAGSGTTDVTVTTPAGKSAASPADQFTYRPPPTVTEVSPNAGPQAGGTPVTLTGTNFTSTSTVKFASSSASSVKVNSASSITAVSPAGSGTVDVTVTTAGGTSTTGSADQFTYVPPPIVTELTPNQGPEAGGTSVVISGSSFTGTTAVRFGSTDATAFTVDSASTITAVSPAGMGTVDVTVTTVGGTSATNEADRFTYIKLAAATTAAPRPLRASRHRYLRVLALRQGRTRH